MSRRAAVGIDDDLAPRQAGVPHRAADFESARRIDVVLRVLVYPLARQDRLDDFLHHRFTKIGEGDIGLVL